MKQILFLVITTLMWSCGPSSDNFKGIYCFLSSTDVTAETKIVFIQTKSDIEKLEKSGYSIDQKQLSEFSGISENYEYVLLHKELLPDFKQIKEVAPSSISYIAEGGGFILYKIQQTIESEHFGRVSYLNRFQFNDYIRDQFIFNPKNIKKDEYHSFLHVFSNDIFPCGVSNSFDEVLPNGNYFIETKITARGFEKGKLLSFVNNFKTQNRVSLDYKNHNININEAQEWKTFTFCDPTPNYLSKTDKFKSFVLNASNKEFDIYAISSTIIDDFNGQARFLGKIQYSKTWHQKFFVESWQKAECFQKENNIRFEQMTIGKTAFHHMSIVHEMDCKRNDELMVEYYLRNINQNDSSFLNIEIKSVNGDLKWENKTLLEKTTTWKNILTTVNIDCPLEASDRLLIYFSNHRNVPVDISNVSFAIVRKNIVCD